MKKFFMMGLLAVAPMVAMAANVSPCTGTAGPGVAAVTGDTSGTYFLRSNSACVNRVVASGQAAA